MIPSAFPEENKPQPAQALVEMFQKLELICWGKSLFCSRDPKGPEGLSATGLRCFHWDEIPRDWC